ncbi:YlxR family protein [Neomicrococcus aestuarii]|uniref:Putative RNA-binding protein YlxR (DUF448 family) n=1 Tax=Neomicrococcus aestuarii TaxID=556325 RepID=A0A7W8TT64_9MICC|nr:YlxR family protein [Neomicrococcus aestuarii]MBB5511600.1 putative RNA-binding protein YlxR (DUF448 family) [Neomicrococcus aestuarii]
MLRWVLEVRSEDSQDVSQIDPSNGVLQVVADPERRKSGRGAWMHPAPECVALAVKKRAFARAFRANGLHPSEDALNIEIAHTTVRYESGSEN